MKMHIFNKYHNFTIFRQLVKIEYAKQMKKVYLVLAGVCIMSIAANAQYKINRVEYNFHTYSYQKDDPYKPIAAGIASLILPGMGQIISGEVGRGFGFLGGFIGSIVVFSTGVGFFISSIPTSENDPINEGRLETGLVIMDVAFLGALSIDICSVIDAVRVAKVNDLAFRDRKKTSYNINIQPYINKSNYTLNGKTSLGLSFRITF